MHVNRVSEVVGAFRLVDGVVVVVVNVVEGVRLILRTKYVAHTDP